MANQQTINLIIGIGLIVLNLIPFVIRKSKLVFLTAAISLLIIFLLFFFQ
ncbi:hypothetical protein J4454_04435 [Candidatus Pacearchaeota archaeon]|nr:hypothetical protein [Candidatus Pacearchaeota archaeon]